ncbi:MAG: hypothetical protein IKI75_04765 [Lachnospiraceae bacterium]|nr:hypothetical protein [Lachnospiraceae bacterium]
MKKNWLCLAALAASCVSLSVMRVQAAPELMPDGEVFDAEYYAQQYPEVAAFMGSTDAQVLYSHYKLFGKDEGRHAQKPGEELTAEELIMSGMVPEQELEKLMAELEIGEEALKDYFAGSVFVGDSVMMGYKYHLNSFRDAVPASSVVLASVGYSCIHALKEVDELHPAFRGQKQPVWKSIAELKPKRVFLFFGANDLVCSDSFTASRRVFILADRIRAASPGTEIKLISMTPVYGNACKGALSNYGVDVLNSLLKQGAAERGFGYVEINAYLKDEKGTLPAIYCSDELVHETAPAYCIWDERLTRFAMAELAAAAEQKKQ